jgi:putative flippase GtrA
MVAGNGRQTNGVLTLNRRWYQPGCSLERFVRYCVVGAINTVTDLSIFVFLTTAFKMAAAPANIVSYTIALCVSFVLNRNFTFRSSAHFLMPTVQFYRFVTINLVSLVGSTAAIWLLSAMMVPIVAKLVTIPLVTAWGFLAVRLFVFPTKI